MLISSVHSSSLCLQHLYFKILPGWFPSQCNPIHLLYTVAACVEQRKGLQWQRLSSAVSSGEKGLQFIYSLFDPIRPMSTFVSTSLGNVCVRVYMCVYLLQKYRKNERKRGRGVEGDDTGGFQGHCRAGFWALHQAHVYFINILPSCQSGRDGMRSPPPPQLPIGVNKQQPTCTNGVHTWNGKFS